MKSSQKTNVFPPKNIRGKSKESQSQNQEKDNQDTSATTTDIIFLITNHHITKLTDFGQVLFQIKINIDDRIISASLSSNNKGLILAYSSNKGQILSTSKMKYLWNGKFNASKNVVGIECCSSGEVVCLESDGRLSKNVFGSLAVHDGSGELKMSDSSSSLNEAKGKLSKHISNNDNKNFKEIQDKLKDVYKSIQDHGKSKKPTGPSSIPSSITISSTTESTITLPIDQGRPIANFRKLGEMFFQKNR